MQALKAAQGRVIAFSAVKNPAGMAWRASGGPADVVDVSGTGRGSAIQELEGASYHSFSFLKGRAFDGPKELKDGFNQGAADALRGCAAILGDCACAAKDVEQLLITATEVRFALDKIEGGANGFPFGVDLPLGIFLDVHINPKAPSPFALIETLFRSLSGHHNEGRAGVVVAFEGLLKGRMQEFEELQAADEGKTAAGSASTWKQKKSKTRSDTALPAGFTAPLAPPPPPPPIG
jgi:hypothetical protein